MPTVLTRVTAPRSKTRWSGSRTRTGTAVRRTGRHRHERAVPAGFLDRSAAFAAGRSDPYPARPRESPHPALRLLSRVRHDRFAPADDVTHVPPAGRAVQRWPDQSHELLRRWYGPGSGV